LSKQAIVIISSVIATIFTLICVQFISYFRQKTTLNQNV